MKRFPKIVHLGRNWIWPLYITKIQHDNGQTFKTLYNRNHGKIPADMKWWRKKNQKKIEYPTRHEWAPITQSLVVVLNEKLVASEICASSTIESAACTASTIAESDKPQRITADWSNFLCDWDGTMASGVFTEISVFLRWAWRGVPFGCFWLSHGQSRISRSENTFYWKILFEKSLGRFRNFGNEEYPVSFLYHLNQGQGPKLFPSQMRELFSALWNIPQDRNRDFGIFPRWPEELCHLVNSSLE